MGKLLLILLVALLFFTVHTSFSQTPKRSYYTQKVSKDPPKIDGLANDDAWNQVEWSGDFTEYDPDNNTPPSQPTAFKLLYDDKNLYVVIRAHDNEPDKIVKRMSRRDGFEGDWVEINIDSRDDKRTAFSFTCSVSGVKGDEYVSEDGNNWDATWDPIWYLKTSIDSAGWTAEMRIPLSQLRFANKEEQVWGIQLTRRFFRNEERSTWQFVPRSESGWVRHYGELRGIKGIKPQKQLEIMPYVLAKTEKFEPEVENPFNNGKSSTLAMGMDGKVGLTSEISLDFTINPDFGQVEADPSQINLSAYRLFFEERRPFFIEGKDIFNFQISESAAGGNFNQNRLFYSRTIGRNPHYFPITDDNEYVDQPHDTKILGAAKITGKNRNGLSWGIMESLTSKEVAEVDSSGARHFETVEPLTNFLVGRVQKEINKANTVIGGMFTATHRNINSTHLEFLHRSAVSGGIDFLHHWDERNYYVSAVGTFSQVNGNEEALLGTQTASERYFQRPDNHHTTLDSTRTSLTGWGSTLKLGKNNGKIRGQTGVSLRSPGLELNDIGFLISTDEINHWLWVQYRILKPVGILREYSLNANEYLHWDFGGTLIYKALNLNSHIMFKNFWRMSVNFNRNGVSISNADLRGGPALKYPGYIEGYYWIGSDNRKKLYVGFSNWYLKGDDSFTDGKEFNLEVNYRPINALNIGIYPSYTYIRNEMQYVATAEAENINQYLVGQIVQNTYRMSVRINFNISPTISVQYWGQPFISSGAYSNFRRITAPKHDEYSERFHQFTPEEIHDTDNNEYEINDTEGIYSFDNPDFNFVQFRSNLVFRWEYIPGSELFLVWNQDRTDNLSTHIERKFSNLSRGLGDKHPHDVFLVKLTYRFIR